MATLLGMLAMLALLVLAGGAWVARRRHQTLAWNRELDLAFGVGTREEMSLRGSLVPMHRPL